MNITFPDGLHTWKHNASVNMDTMRQIIMIAPQRVVDVGCGDGVYAKLVRKLYPSCHIVGIEKSVEYVEAFKLLPHYDEIKTEDIVTANTGVGDLIIFGDVLEHLEKKDVVPVVDRAVRDFRFVLINSPIGFQPQSHENPNEWHLCGLDRNDFTKYTIVEWHDYDHEGKCFNCLLWGRR